MTYIGPGFIVGIPATDLSDDDIKALAEARNEKPAELRKALAESGLYQEKKKP